MKPYIHKELLEKTVCYKLIDNQQRSLGEYDLQDKKERKVIAGKLLTLRRSNFGYTDTTGTYFDHPQTYCAGLEQRGFFLEQVAYTVQLGEIDSHVIYTVAKNNENQEEQMVFHFYRESEFDITRKYLQPVIDKMDVTETRLGLVFLKRGTGGDINLILEKMKSHNIPSGHCYACKKPLSASNKKFCGSACRYRFQQTCAAPSAKYYDYRYMYVYLGEAPGGGTRGQGRRCGGYVRGSMAAYSSQWSGPEPVTPENIERSLSLSDKGIFLCNGAVLNKRDTLVLKEYLKENQL